jgi:general secretion pathway protein N
MVGWCKLIRLVLLSGGMLAGLSAESPAATSSTLDVISTDRAGDAPDTVDIGRVTPIAKPNRETARPLPAGNPLWSIPLSVLSATQERPIFSASRRPPQRAVVAPPVDEVVAVVKPAEPDRPPLVLIGAVVGEGDAIAIFLDQTSQKIVRLRQGDTHAGWHLGSVQGREVTVTRADRSEVLVLQRPERTAGAPAAAGGEAAMPVSQPLAGAMDASYAPFVPRSTPKNGESDGL